MEIQVVLTGNDSKLGKRGEVIKVSSGYAHNYLFPNRKAAPATPATLKRFEQEKARHFKEEAGRLAQARHLAEKLLAQTVRLELTAGEGEKLFGAVTAQHIVDALEALGLRCERKRVHLEEPIKKLGEHAVEIRLHPEVTVKLRLLVAKRVAG